MAMGSVGKRKAERRGCQVKAQVIRPDGSDPLDCLILDFSATGARVKLNAQTELPARFKLYIPSRPETKSVILRWTKGLEFGCEYSTGVADEKTFFDLIDRVARLEKTAGAGGDPQALADMARRIETLETRTQGVVETAAPDEGEKIDVDAAALLRRRIDKVAKVAQGYARRSEQFLSRRMDETEERLRALLARDQDAVSLVMQRLDAFEKMGQTAAEKSGQEDAAQEQMAAALERRVDQIAETAATNIRRSEQFLSARMDQTEERLRELLAPDVAERLARLEAMAEMGALAAPAPLVGTGFDGPDPRIVSRIADLEARLMSAPRAASSFDPSALEARIAEVAHRAEEAAERVERFLMTRMDDLETQIIAAPAAPAPMRSAEIVDLELKLHELAARIEHDAATPVQAAPSATASGDLAGLAERISDLEMSVMELRLDQPAAQGAGDADLHRRILEMEGRHAEIIGTLRNLLALLTAGEARRVAG